MKKKGLGSPADKLGVHIRKYRNQKKWSQKDLANKIGTDQKRISKIENGNVNPSLDSLLRVLVSMGKTIKVVPI